MRIFENLALFMVLLAMGGGATFMWGKYKTKEAFQRKINKGNEDANKTRHRIRTDSKFRARIRKLFDSK